MSAGETSWPEWAKWVQGQLKDHQGKLQQISSELTILERKMRPLFCFWMRRQILITLRNEGRPRTWNWLRSRLGVDAWEPLQELEHEGMVAVTKSGSHILYSVKEAST